MREVSERGYRPWAAAVALTCAGLIFSALVPAVSDARQVRAFAVGPKIEIDRWFDTRQSYRDKLFALFDRRLRGGPGVPQIQQGAGDVASRQLGPRDPRRPVRTARDLVALPEDVGLWTMLVGPRGEQARQAGSAEGASLAAVGSLGTTYAPQVAYYTSRFPELGARGVPARALIVALTDTFARVGVETFAELADRHDAFLHAGVNMARDWKVVCEDMRAFNQAPRPRLPGGERCEEENPVKVAQLRAPEEPNRDYAYEATTSDAVNMGLVFNPNGRLIAKEVKAYLTPVELPGVGLDLVPGPVSGLGAIHTPVGTLGVQTSKDAWMPDVQAKHDLRGVDVLIQPEYFVGDTVRSEGPWSADTLHASGYNNVLRRPGVEAMVLPELTGNAFDLSADAQSHIALRVRSRGAPRRALVGQPRQRGFASVARWAVRDRLGPDETIAERRLRLGRAGERMQPGSGIECPDETRAGPCENGMVEQVIFADLRVGRTPARRPYRGPVRTTRFARNRPLRPAPNPQRNVALDAHRRLVVAAYEQMRGRRSRVVVRRSRDGGRSLAPGVARPGGGPRQWTPDVAVAGNRVVAAWVEVRGGSQRVHVAVSRNGGRSFGRSVEAPPAPLAGSGLRRQWEPALAALPGGGAYLVYLEEADDSDDDGLPQTRVFGRRVGADGSLGLPQRLDGGEPDELARKLDHSWAPSVAAQGRRVTVAWVDFQTYDWRPYGRTSEDGGETFGPQAELGSGRAPDGTEALEVLADSPSAAVDGRGSYVAWTDWRKEEATASRVSRGYDTWIVRERGGGFEPEARADDRGPRQLSTFWPAVAARGGDAFVAWQDSAGGIGTIRLARLADGVTRRRALRVDDLGRGGINQYRPAVALSQRRLVVAWEDERNGPRQIYLTRTPLSRLP